MQNVQALEQNKAELTKAEGAEGGGETRLRGGRGGREGPWDPYKHWHLCGEHQEPSLQGHGAKNRMFVRLAGPERGPGSRGRCWLCSSPATARLRNCSAFPLHSLRALLHSQCPQLLPDCSQGHSWHPERAQAARARGLTLRAQRFLALSETGETLPLDTPIPLRAHRGRRSRNTAGAAGAVQTSGISQEERGRKEWEVHGCCSPREHIILLLMQRSKAWTGPELLSS